MKRYYICRIIGTGNILVEPPDAYRSEMADYLRNNWPDEPKAIRLAIHPNVLMWCVSKYDLSQAAHDDVMANLTGIYAFPQGALDRELGSIDPTLRANMRTKLENIVFNFAWATGTNTIRDVLKYLFHSIQLASWAQVQITAIGDFDFDTEVRDIPQAKRQNINGHLQDLGIDTSWITGPTTMRQIINRVMFLEDSITPRLFGKIKKRQWFYHDEDIE